MTDEADSPEGPGDARSRILGEAVEFWEKAYLAVLPYAMEASGWSHDGKDITTGRERAWLAARWADYASTERLSRIKAYMEVERERDDKPSPNEAGMSGDPDNLPNT